MASDQKPAVSKSGRKIRGRGTMVRSVIHPLFHSLYRSSPYPPLHQCREQAWSIQVILGVSSILTFLYSGSVPAAVQRYHTPTRSKSRSASVELRGDSETPPHWKEEMKRTKACPPPSVEKWSKGDK